MIKLKYDITGVDNFLSSISSGLTVSDLIAEKDRATEELMRIGKLLNPDSNYYRPSGLEGLIVLSSTRMPGTGNVVSYIENLKPVDMAFPNFVVFPEDKKPEADKYVIITSATIRESQKNPGNYYIKCFNWLSFDEFKENEEYYTMLFNTVHTLMKYREILEGLIKTVREVDEQCADEDVKTLISKVLALMVFMNQYKPDGIIAQIACKYNDTRLAVVRPGSTMIIYTRRKKIRFDCALGTVSKMYMNYTVPEIHVTVTNRPYVDFSVSLKYAGYRDDLLTYNVLDCNTAGNWDPSVVLEFFRSYTVYIEENYPWNLEGLFIHIAAANGVVYIDVDEDIYDKEEVKRAFDKVLSEKAVDMFSRMYMAVGGKALDMVIKAMIDRLFYEIRLARDMTDLWRWFNESI